MNLVKVVVVIVCLIERINFKDCVNGRKMSEDGGICCFTVAVIARLSTELCILEQSPNHVLKTKQKVIKSVEIFFLML
jgi:hypothetical protein